MNETKETAIAKTAARKPAVKTGSTEMNYPALFEMAMSNEKGLEIIERLTALKNSEEERQYKKEFMVHFAAMQKEFKPVPRSKNGSKTNTGIVAFKYAPIEAFVLMNGEAVTSNGFSNTWTEESVEGKPDWLRVRIHISGHGYTNSETSAEVPPVNTNSLTTDSQARNSQKAIGRRTTYIEGYGMIAIDEDIPLSLDETLDYAEEIKTLNNCQTAEVLHVKVNEVAKKLKDDGDMKGYEIIRKYYTARKEELKRGGK